MSSKSKRVWGVNPSKPSGGVKLNSGRSAAIGDNCNTLNPYSKEVCPGWLNIRRSITRRASSSYPGFSMFLRILQNLFVAGFPNSRAVSNDEAGP